MATLLNGDTNNLDLVLAIFGVQLTIVGTIDSDLFWVGGLVIGVFALAISYRT